MFLCTSSRTPFYLHRRVFVLSPAFGKLLISLPSAPPVELGLCFAPLESILTWHPMSFATWLVVPPALGPLRRYLLLQKGVTCRFLPERDQYFATTVLPRGFGQGLAYRKGSGDDQPMSALGQKRTYAVQNGVSALLRKADMCDATSDVR